VDDGSGEIAQVLGVDPGGDSAVREMKVIGDARLSTLLAPDAVFVPEEFARRHGLTAGKSLRIVAGGVRRVVKVAALLELTGVARAAGGDLLVTDLFTAQRLLGKEGSVDRVDIALDAGQPREAIAARVRAVLPAGLTLQSPGRSAATADRMVRAFRFNLNALASLTLLVAMFLIANAVSISVLRRRPEIATLRALGASRSSIFAVFVAEGLSIGILGTLLGEAGGVFLARAALNLPGPANGLPADGEITAAGTRPPAPPRPWIVSALLATLPAAEATRVEPSPPCARARSRRSAAAASRRAPRGPSRSSSSRPSRRGPAPWTDSRSSGSPRSASSSPRSRSRRRCLFSSPRAPGPGRSSASSARPGSSPQASSAALSPATGPRSPPWRWRSA
jgi:putative ABC transport system permease protein